MVNGKCTGVALMVIPNTRHPAKVVVEGDWGLDVMIRLFK